MQSITRLVGVSKNVVITALVEANEAPPRKRGHYKKLTQCPE